MARISDLFRSWRDDQCGGFAVYAALTLPVILATAGFGLDYMSALSTKSRFDAAADSAAIAGVRAATAYMKKNPQGLLGDSLLAAAKAAGQTAAQLSFNSNAAASLDWNPTATAPLTDYDADTNTFHQTISYTFVAPIHFGQLVGEPTMTLAGFASAEQKATTFIRFNILVDTSQSMGIAANTAEMAKLYAAAKCVFACHSDDPSYSSSYNAARSQNIQLRIDVARQAIYNMASAAQSLSDNANIQFAVYGMSRQSGGPPNAKIINQYQYRTYPQPQATGYWSQVWPASGVANTDYANLMNAMSPGSRILDLSLWPSSAWNGPAIPPPPLRTQDFAGANVWVGATDLTTSISQIADQLPAGGDGASPSSPKTFAFVVSDGLDNIPFQSRIGCTLDPTQAFKVQWCENPIRTSACDPLKNKNMLVAGIYTTYNPIYDSNDPKRGYDSSFDPLFGGKYNLPYTPDIAAVNQVGSIPGNFKKCVQDESWYFEAGDDVALLKAMASLFQNAMSAVNRLTQ